MPNPRFSTQDWYCHPANKRAEKEPIMAPPASQIPGLSNLPDEAMETEDDRTCRRKWIRDTDTKYIRLAKKGGRQGLLAFKDPKPPAEEAVPYPRVDWFDHENAEDEETKLQYSKETETKQTSTYQVLPEWYIHDRRGDPGLPCSDDQTIPGLSRRREQPQNAMKSKGNILSWERQGKVDSNTTQQKLPPLQVKKEKAYRKPLVQEKTAVPEQKKHCIKLPQINNEPVDFHHLLGMGYQHDWLDEQRSEQKQQRQEKEEKRKEKQNKKAIQMAQAIQMRKPRHSTNQEKKPLFKLSKFERVQPRVESFRL